MVKNKLKEIRMKEYMMEKKEFAIFLNIGLATYYNWENGDSKPPLEKALEIAEKLNKHVEEIWYL
ncbi:helix-turn-helix domain-containing protein [Clostridium sp. SHJSY1]|uniref:helix-turn-helix transcriptional regulator n=1 Tax=Clostridium sp. SHJSY1 TaxID=2942483 RepID=UPI0028757197|nr:helix-turn-helix domain-containing protein [Clostridium sp. SHJSY1]MDS0525444.1 helix-turn-helix domain-containing protein [Clostridium sp. SHJSY1]